MLLTRREWPILVFNLVYIPIFSVIALQRANYEFILYVVVILVAGGSILAKQRKVRFDLPILWGLSIWGLAHMMGGNVGVGDGVVYGVILVPILPEYNILRYDQVVHMFGFGVMTLVCHHLLQPYLRPDIIRWRTLAVLIMLMGSGVGAINEIIEFVAVLTVPETGVGGYHNTMLDLVFNLIGGIIAVTWLTWIRKHGQEGPGAVSRG
jgi:putative membrane protein